MAETLTAPFLSTSALDAPTKRSSLAFRPIAAPLIRAGPSELVGDEAFARPCAAAQSPQQFRAALNGPQLLAAQWHHFEPHSYARGLMRDERGDESLGTCRAPFLHHHLHQLPPGLGTPSRAQPVRRESKPPAKQLPTYLPWALQLHTCTRCLRACASPRACVARVRAIVGGHPL